MVQAAQTARARGHLPGGIEELIRDVLEPRMPWEELLRQFLDMTARGDYSWLRGNRRFLHQGLYLPSLYSEELEIVIAVDTSGSVRPKELGAFQAEINGILGGFGMVRVTLIQCDTEINEVREIESHDLPLEIAWKGRGGTEFEPPFRYVESEGLMPSALVYLTDGGASVDFEEPPFPVLWLSTSQTDFPWGEVVKMEL